MSFDDGSLGRDENSSSRPAGIGVVATLTTVYDRLVTHVREWPEQYVEMRARRHER